MYAAAATPSTGNLMRFPMAAFSKLRMPFRVVGTMSFAALAADASGQTPGARGANGPVSPSLSSSAPALHVAWSGPVLAAPDRARLSTLIAQGDTLSAQHHVADAARLYWSVVAEQRAAVEYPDVALRRLAVLYFDMDEEYVAAGVFMELAQSAAEFGDATTQLRSLFDAALMYKRLGRNDRVGDCVQRIWPLLKSPAIAESIRLDIGARLVER
jgi:hypothetical protein